MFHATYVGKLSSLNVNVKGPVPGEVVYPLTLQPDYPQTVPENSASAISIQWGTGWTEYMQPVYVPTEVPGTSGQLYVNWSPDNQVVIVTDYNETGS